MNRVKKHILYLLERYENYPRQRFLDEYYPPITTTPLGA